MSKQAGPQVAANIARHADQDLARISNSTSGASPLDYIAQYAPMKIACYQGGPQAAASVMLTKDAVVQVIPAECHCLSHLSQDITVQLLKKSCHAGGENPIMAIDDASVFCTNNPYWVMWRPQS